MPDPAAVQAAAAAWAMFHRAALAAGLLLFAITIYKKWSHLGAASGPVGHVVAATLAGVAIPEALFPLYWLTVKGGSIHAIAATQLELYTYVGCALMVLMSVIGIREAWK